MGESEPRLVFTGGPALWPLNSGVGLFRASYRRTMAKLPVRPRVEKRDFATLPEALDDITQRHSMAADDVKFVAATRGDDWTAVLDAGFPYADVGNYWRARAMRDVQCDYVCYQWVPASPASVPEMEKVFAAAAFFDYRHVRRMFGGRPQQSDTRSIETGDQDAGWEFHAVGPQRDYEQPENYTRRRKAERLPLPVIEAYLAACGIPVGQEDWLSGPVTALVDAGHGLKRRDWKSLSQLRSMVGYPAEGIPATLTGWRTDD
jgi:hypothetical protein